MLRRMLATCMLLICIASGALAHGGKTDSKGGHTDRSTGEYHYHHGYGAHQHPNGVCPYDFDDKTGQSSGGPSSGYSSRATPRPTVTPKPKSEAKEGASLSPLLFVVLLAASVLSIQGIRSRSNKEIEILQNQLHATREALEAKELSIQYFKQREQVVEKRNEEIEQRALQLDGEYKKLQRKKDEQAEIIRSFFEKHSLRELSGMPDNVKFGPDGLPREKDDPIHWGYRYTFYLSNVNSTKYHTRDCRYAYIPIHAYRLGDIEPCRLCKASAPILEPWYFKYNELKSQCVRYGVEPKPDD